MVVLWHSMQYKNLGKIFSGNTNKNDFFWKFFFKPKFYLALAIMFSEIWMLFSQPSLMKKLNNLIAVLCKPYKRIYEKA